VDAKVMVEHDESLITEQLARNSVFLGEEGVKSLRNSFVIVVGLGGVGSYTALMLLRSGVGHLRLIDFDQVTLSSLNRHAVATRADVGTPKVQACKDFFQRVAPWVRVEAVKEMFSDRNAGTLLSGEPSFVIDAIDNIATKVQLLHYCAVHDIKVMSSMGAGAKADPSRIQIADISTTIEDPLSRVVRRRLRQCNPPVVSGIPVTYSTERPSHVKLLPLDESEVSKGNINELSVLEDFRIRILPVLGPLPALFGLTIATHVITTLAGFPTEPLEVKNRRKLYERAQKELQKNDNKVFDPAAGHTSVAIPLNRDDVGLIYEEIHRGRSIIPPNDPTSRPILSRWRPDQPLSKRNCVVLTREEYEKHEKEVLKGGRSGREVWGEEVEALVLRRQREVDEMEKWL